MNIVLLTFTKDAASMNMRTHLLEYFSQTNIVFDSYTVLEKKDFQGESKKCYVLTTDKESIFYENIDKEILRQTNISPDLLIFCTKHESKAKIQSLSCHTQGNFGKARYGGKDFSLGICPSIVMENAFLAIQEAIKKEDLAFEPIIECTHHGPYVETPSLFIEIGSSNEAFTNESVGKVMATIICKVVEKTTKEDIILQSKVPTKSLFQKPSIVGLGGLHHCPSFSKRIKHFYVGHVCPKYQLEQLTKASLEEAILKTIPLPTHIVLDWKGMTDKERVLNIVQELSLQYNLTVKKIKDFD